MVGPSHGGGSGGPLQGVTVVDLSAVGPAARCTRLLADYGAAVVKVGPVPAGGPPGAAAPGGSPGVPAAAPWWAYGAGRGTRRLGVDLRRPEGVEAFLALAAGADVVVESFRPGVAERLGIGYGAVSARNPAVIYVSTSGYGQSGPRSGWAGHDLDYLAVGGYLAMSEPAEGGRPPLPGATVADAAAGGMHAALAVCAALVRRSATGEGAYLDVAVADGVLWLMSLALEEHLATGAEPRPGHDVLSGRYACYGTYRAGDGRYLAVAAIEPKFFANLCNALGCGRWASRQYDDDVQEELRAVLGAAFLRRSRDEWVEQLAGADTCVAPVLEISEVAADAHFARRGAFVEAGGGGSRLRQLGPVLAGMAPVREPGPAAGRGAGDSGDAGGGAGRDASDAEELLLAAGLSAQDVAGLLGAGVVA
jgi:alpha-methylacyl-CoA racemase